jgi:hypothetical protein
MPIYQPKIGLGQFVANQIAAKFRSESRANVLARKQTERAFFAGASFPNNNGGYVRVEKPQKESKPLTPRERFFRLVAAFKDPTACAVFQSPRKPSRGRSKRRRITGIRVFDKIHSFAK